MAQTLDIPSDALVVLCGPTGSGKSTFAAKHFGRTQIVSSDECRELVTDDPASQACSGDAFAILYAIARARLNFRRLTVVDSTALSSDSRRNLLKIADECGTPTVLIFFRVPREVCLARNERRQRRVPVEVIERQCEEADEAASRIHEERFGRVYELTTANIDTAEVVMGPSHH